MITIHFKINGQEIALKDLDPDSAEAAYLEDVAATVQRRIGRIWCSEHRKAPWALASGPSPDKLKVSVQGCCQKIVGKAKEAMANP